MGSSDGPNEENSREQVQTGHPMAGMKPDDISDEEWAEMTPNRQPSLLARIFYWISSLLVVAVVIAPLAAFNLYGFEEAIVAFLTGYLLFIAL